MKTNVRFPFVGRFALVLLLVVPSLAFAQAERPAIRAIFPGRSNVTVEVDVPAGVQRVTLESRSRLGSGAWAPAAVQYTDGVRTLARFTLPLSERMEILRVRADYSLPLPGKFYDPNSLRREWSTNYAVLFGPAFSSDIRDNPPATREVVESDIWKLDGDRLYFFNTYRGLQILDITNPDDATVIGSYPLPAAGEDMYLLGSNHVVLLARDGCSGPARSDVLFVSVTNAAQPALTAKLPVEGQVLESRLVGSALYVASQTYREFTSTNGTTWEWGTIVSSFDLAEPSRPEARGTLWFPGYGNVVMATDILLFVGCVSPQNEYDTALRMIDITSPDGKMATYGAVRTRGRIQDKFKLQYANNVLTTIAEDWRRTNGVNVTTWLETFRVPDPRSAPPGGITKLGELELGRGERLHATRFDADKAYIVTFFQIDPLWVVDLSDAARPRIAGELEVPGWSTYIHPMGDRLLSVGVETNRVAVSLFDVTHPGKPALLSRVLLGENHSWSTANDDEKALTVFEDKGMVLLPYSGDTTNGWASRVQLIDLTRSNLVARGVVEHAMQPRRSGFHRDRVLSLSGMELLSVNATNRDLPVVSGRTPLSWSVDRVWLAGDYVVELTGNAYGLAQSRTVVRVAPADAPNASVTEFDVGEGHYAGAALRSNLLYIAQTLPSSQTGKVEFILTILDASALPQVQVLGRTPALIQESGSLYANWTPVWAGESVLVWAGAGWGGWIAWGAPLLMTDALWRGPWFSSDASDGHLVAFQVANPANPLVSSELDLMPEEGWRRFSVPYAAGSLVYISQGATELAPGTTNTWVNRDYLHVIDYADPSAPARRKPVTVPGVLAGLSHGGEMIYTKTARSQINDYSEWLNASAYDGLVAYPVATLPLGPGWPRPSALDGPHVYKAVRQDASGTNAAKNQLQRWFVNAGGEFELDAEESVGAPVTTLWIKNGLLAAQHGYEAISLWNASQPKDLLSVGKLVAPGCMNPILPLADGALGEGIWIPMGGYGVAWTTDLP